MTVLSIILGVLLIFGGISCLFTPLATFLSTGYFLAILLLVYGIIGLVKAFRKRAAVLEGVVSVLAILVGLFAIFRPGSQEVFDAVLLVLLACWFLIQGVVSVVISIRTRPVNRYWVLTLIAGILGIVLGLYSFAHPMVAALTAGYLIGFYFLQAGFDLITLGFAAKTIKDAVEKPLR